MRLTNILRHHGFGNLAKVYGITVFKISPFEQKAFARAIDFGLPNTIRRISSNVFIVLPPFVVGYVIFSWAESKHKKLLRKDPSEFADDE